MMGGHFMTMMVKHMVQFVFDFVESMSNVFELGLDGFLAGFRAFRLFGLGFWDLRFMIYYI